MKYNGIICEANKPARVQRVQHHAKRQMTVEDYEAAITRLYSQADNIHFQAEQLGDYSQAMYNELDSIEAAITLCERRKDTAPARSEWQPAA